MKPGPPSNPGGQAGKTLTASKTATGFWEKTTKYDWTLAKTFMVNEDGPITYTLTTKREASETTNVYDVRSQITVTNGGGEATENLNLGMCCPSLWLYLHPGVLEEPPRCLG